jgi:alpha-galactosidase
MLAVYELQERLVTEFPNLLLENCSGGGARFDPGMLYYGPQIWCSDDTDAIERLGIQEGTALIYPLSSMGAHVSDCPNHTVGRVTPFETRGHVALAGTFGYELDITKIPEEDRNMIPQQTAMYHKYHSLVRSGDYYRIASYRETRFYDCYGVVSKDKSEALFTFVQVVGRPNYHSRLIKLAGLDPEAKYRIEDSGDDATELYGRTIMEAGILIQNLWGDYKSKLIHLVRV